MQGYMGRHTYKRLKEFDNCELYWCGTFWKSNRSPNWYINLYFYDGNIIHQGYLEAGVLPSLVIGSKINNGTLLPPEQSFLSHRVSIPDFSKGKLVKFADMPKDLYSFHSFRHLANELVYKIYAGGFNVFIPQVELVRSLIAHNTLLTNSLLEPSGLDFLISSIDIDDEILNVELGSDYPKKLISNKNISYLMAIIRDRNLRDFYESVYRNTKTANKQQIIDLIPFQSIEFKGDFIKSGNNILITRIKEVKGITSPFKKIVFSHPLIQQKEVIECNEFDRASTEAKKKTDKLVVDESAGYDVNRSVSSIENTSVTISFTEDVQVVSKFKEKSSKSRKYNKTDEKKDTPEKNEVFSVGQIVGDGKARPMELEAETFLNFSSVDNPGLEMFIDALKHLNKYRPVIHWHTGYIESSSAFANLEDGQRRAYIVIELAKTIIIEIARPDDFPVSTLILNKDHEEADQIAAKALDCLDKNTGHWDKNRLDRRGQQYTLAKHMKGDTPTKWAMRLLEKLL